MSKRARITLSPEAESEQERAAAAAAVPEAELEPQHGVTTPEDEPATPSLPASWLPSARTIVKAVVIGVAVASAVLLWKNRRP